jgi:FkbM family methyltransferase
MKNIQSRVVNQIELRFEDFSHSCVRLATFNELESDYYKTSKISFKEGDIVFDIGANIGMVSIYLAKKYPFLKIYSFEPVPENYSSLINNIKLNDVSNVFAYNLGVYKNNSKMKFIMRPDNSGGGTMFSQKTELDDHFVSMIDCKSLDSIIEDLNIEKIKLMKIDCEGSEYDIFYSCENLSKIEYLSAEFHTNSNLLNRGYTAESLVSHLSKYINPEKITYYTCRMTD